MLSIKHLSVAIQSIEILRSVHLEVAEGSMCGLIGRNGAGKTTLMRAVMGLLPAREGSINFASGDLTRTPAHARSKLGIGYMPEDRRLVPTLSVEENVLIPAWSAGVADPNSRLAEVYTMIPEVREFSTRKGLQLSGGQQKLVALARALMCGDKLLLLDEPFEGVAPVLAMRLAEVITGLKKKGLSVILTESDLAHSGEMLDAVYTIDRGQVTTAA